MLRVAKCVTFLKLKLSKHNVLTENLRMYSLRPSVDNPRIHHHQGSRHKMDIIISEIGSNKNVSETDEELQCAPTLVSSSEDLSDEELLDDSFSPKKKTSLCKGSPLRETRRDKQIRKSLMKVFSSPLQKFSTKSDDTKSGEDKRDQSSTLRHESGICSFPSPTLTDDVMASKIRRVKGIFPPSKEPPGTVKPNSLHSNIGLLLALPDKIDIMRGLEAPNNCKGFCEAESWPNRFPMEKKLLILPENSNVPKRTLRMSMKSPFKSRHGTPPVSTGNKTHNDTIPNASGKSTEIDILRTGEIDPSAHQVIIPDISEILVHVRICMVMEGYDGLMKAQTKAGKIWFDFASLVGLSRHGLESMYLGTIDKETHNNTREKEELPPPLFTTQRSPFKELLSRERSCESLDSGSLHAEASKLGQNLIRLKQKIATPHRSTLRNLLMCADDLVVEAHFTETVSQRSASASSKVENGTNVVQVTICSSQRLRQFIVCYRSSSSQHAKPVATSVKVRNGTTKDKQKMNNFFSLNEQFQNAYLESNLEGKVFKCLDELSTKNPFCDVCYTGHSFAAALSLIGAVRCAEQFSMLTVNCNLFGCPKVGKHSFRVKAHSLPNLSIFRIENATDPFTDLPRGDWEHAGHSIVVSKKRVKQKIGDKCDARHCGYVAQAFKFGKVLSSLSSSANQKGKKSFDQKFKFHKSKGKEEHKLSWYAQSMEAFSKESDHWVSSFMGEHGRGIVALDQEERLIV